MTVTSHKDMETSMAIAMGTDTDTDTTIRIPSSCMALGAGMGLHNAVAMGKGMAAPTFENTTNKVGPGETFNPYA